MISTEKSAPREPLWHASEMHLCCAGWLGVLQFVDNPGQSELVSDRLCTLIALASDRNVRVVATESLEVRESVGPRVVCDSRRPEVLRRIWPAEHNFYMPSTLVGAGYRATPTCP